MSPTVSAGRRTKARPPAPAPDPVTAYARDVIDGRIVAGVLVRQACARHLADLETGPERGLVFDLAAAQRAIDFFPLLRHYKGELGRPSRAHPQGHPIDLEPWQVFFIGSLFGWKRADGTRRFRQGYLEVAKKNGKTLLAAGIGLLLAFFDDEPGAEVYAGATKRDQAKLVWNDARMMVLRNPGLRRRIAVYAGSLTDEGTASFFKPLGKDADTDQGINAHGAIIDELHVHGDRELIANLETATSARRQPLTVKITTAGTRGASVWEEERADAVAVVEGRTDDDAMLVLVYTLDPDDDPFDEAVWPKANPNLGVSVNPDTLREQAAAARRSPGKLAAYLRYRMDVPTDVATRAIDLDEWDRCATEPDIPDGATVYAGLDLASVRDLSALVLVHRDEQDVHHVLARFWCPEEGIERRSRADGVPYLDWVRDGHLTATPGAVTDYAYIREEIRRLAERFHIVEIGYDRWNATQLATDLTADGATMAAVSQSFAGMAPAWREVEKVLLEHRFRHGGHPVLRWMAANVETETDAAGNQRPSKGRSSERIDGMVALTIAESRWMTHVEEPKVQPFFIVGRSLW